MGSHVPTDEDARTIRQAVDAALRDPVFVRSPVLVRLLNYLADQTIAGAELSSYIIAIDGLGRSTINLHEADTYARVAVARLRRTLAQHYAAHPSRDQLHVETGTYAVRLRSEKAVNEPAAPSASRTSEEAQEQPRRRTIRQLLLALALALVAVAVLALAFSDAERNTRWSEPDFPNIAVVSAPDSQGDPQIEASRRAMLAALSAYVGQFVIEDTTQTPDYRLSVFGLPGGEEGEQGLTFEVVASSRIIWSGTMEAGSPRRTASQAANIAAGLASPGGIMHSYARRQGYATDTPYGCWLRFTEAVQTYNSIGDRQLAACAESWYEVAPQRPLAAYLYAWTLIDASVTQLRAAKREATLQQALDIIHRALVLNPDFAILHLAEMRAYSFLGNRHEVRRAAIAAIENSRGNRLVIGMAAGGLTLWNDLEGETILADLRDAPNVPLPWENVALFIAAMMDDDPSQARVHLDQLEPFQMGQPLLALLKGAYARRTGDPAAASAAMARLKSNALTRFVPPDALVDRLPTAPEVKARLKSWLNWPDGAARAASMD